MILVPFGTLLLGIFSQTPISPGFDKCRSHHRFLAFSTFSGKRAFFSTDVVIVPPVFCLFCHFFWHAMGSSLHTLVSLGRCWIALCSLGSSIRISTSFLELSRYFGCLELVLSASSSCSPSAFLFLSLSTLAFAVGDPAGSCCSSCSLFSPCGSGSCGLRIPDADADAVPGVGGAAAGSYHSSVTMSIL